LGEFGDKFRREREKQGISLDDVSRATKISCRMLKAIEDEQFDRLPGGIFNKGFVRAYAQHLGLNEDEAVDGYVACQAELDSHEQWDAQTRGASPPSSMPNLQRPSLSPSEELPGLQLPRAEHVRPPRRDYLERRDRENSWRLVALAVLVVVLTVLLWHRHPRSTRPVAASAPPTPSATQPATPSPKSPAAPVTNSATTPSGAARASTRPLAPHTPIANPHLPIIAPVKAAATAAVHKEGNVQEENVAADSSVPPGQPVAAPAAALNLVIRASENSWISVTADGRAVIHELLIAPAHTSVHAAHEISVRVGNAGGVTFLWNGQELPAQGAEAEVVTLLFDASGLRVVPTTEAPSQNR
jgi:cytoskeleton protein RodZ